MLSIGRRDGSRNLQARTHQPARRQKVVRREAGVGVGIGVPLVEHEQFVQQRRAGAPMPDHEDRIVLDLRALDLPSVQSDLEEPEEGS